VKKVLIITYYWPPSGGAGVQRWLKFVKYLRNFGWEPIIYTAENAEYPVLDVELAKDIPKNVTVYAKEIKEPYTYYKKLMGRKKEERVYSGFLQEDGRRNWRQKLALFIRANIFIPDARCMWIKPSAKYLIEKLKTEKIDLIISTGPPHSMHLIAMKIKRKTALPWIADFRDPWTNIDFADDLPFTKWAINKNEKLEKKVLQNADQIIVVSALMKEEFESKTKQKVNLITNGFDTDDFSARNQSSIAHKYFQMIHTGSLNNRRNHLSFWKAISELSNEFPEVMKRVKIKLIGKTDIDARNAVERYKLGELVEFQDYLPHEKIIDEQLQSDLLLLFINRFGENKSEFRSAKGTVTGKLFEYLACRKPILAIGLVESQMADIINETKAGKTFDFDDVSGLKSFILQVVNKEFKVLSDTSIAKYSRLNLTQQLAQLMDETLKDGLKNSSTIN